MTAIVTKMQEYRERKTGKGTKYATIQKLTNAQVLANRDMAQAIDSGAINLSELPESLATQLYPNGYDPENHPEDNYDVLVREAERRGIVS